MLTENSASLIRCNRLTCKGDGKLFNLKIEFIWRVPTMKKEYFEISKMFLQLIWRVSAIMTEIFQNQRNFPGIFRRFSDLTWRSFPTIFRQLSDNESKSKAALPGLEPMSLRINTCYSTTLPQSLCIFVGLSAITCLTFSLLFSFFIALFIFISTLSFLSSMCLPSSVLCSPSSLLCFSWSVLC